MRCGQWVAEDAAEYLAIQRASLADAMADVAARAEAGPLHDVTLDAGLLRIRPLKAEEPPEVGPLAQAAYDLMPRIKITNLLLEVDRWTGFSECFTHQRSGRAPDDRPALLTKVLADGINLGLTRMSEACRGAGYRFAPRLRDLKDRTLYAFRGQAIPDALGAMVGGTIDVDHLAAHWEEALHLAVSVGAGHTLGQALPEDEMGLSMGVSRTPMREALALLQLQGLVVIVPKKGTFVFQPSLKDLKQLASFRLMLETSGVERCLAEAPGATLDDLKATQECDQRLGFTRNVRLPDDLPGRVQHLKAAQLQRYVDPNMMLHDHPGWTDPKPLGSALCHHSGRDPPRMSAPVQAHYGIYRTPYRTRQSKPPSTTNICPVQPRLSSEARNRAMRAHSAGCNSYFRHCSSRKRASSSGVRHRRFCLAVMIAPGTRVFTRMFSPPNSRASPLVSPCTPALAVV